MSGNVILRNFFWHAPGVKILWIKGLLLFFKSTALHRALERDRRWWYVILQSCGELELWDRLFEALEVVKFGRIQPPINIGHINSKLKCLAAQSPRPLEIFRIFDLKVSKSD